MIKKSKKSNQKKQVIKPIQNKLLDKLESKADFEMPSDFDNNLERQFQDELNAQNNQAKNQIHDKSHFADLDQTINQHQVNDSAAKIDKTSANTSKNTNKKGVYNKYNDLALSPTNNQQLTNKPARVFALILGTIALISVVLIGTQAIPNVLLSYTDDAVATRKKADSESKSKQKEDQRKKNIEEENRTLTFTDRKVDLSIKDYGTLKIALTDKAAPKTTENFIRLVNRGFYNGLVFHRIVTEPNFNVIQGGDPDGTGKGGETASGSVLPDELWEVKPEFATDEKTGNQAAGDPNEKGILINDPKFKDPSLYKNFDRATGSVTYSKGQILMAKTSAPDSATSQFFIALSDIKLPAQYTIFGSINPENYNVLDKILAEVKPVVVVDPAQAGSGKQGNDGKPDKELKIEKAVLE